MNGLGNNLRFFYSAVTLSWGFTVRYREVSAAQPSYILPPPTTVVGAFGRSFGKLLGLLDAPLKDPLDPEHKEGYVISRAMKFFLESTVAASAGIIGTGGLVVHQELSKIHASIYKGDKELSRIKAEPFSKKFYKESLSRIFPALAVGASYGPGIKIYLSWVLDVDKLLDKFKKNRIFLKEEDIDSVGPLAVHGLTRIGSKEGIVASEPELTGYEKNPKIISEGEKVRTIQYVQSECVDLEETIPLVFLPSIDYKLKQYYVPSTDASNSFLIPFTTAHGRWMRLKNQCKAYAPKNHITEFTSVGL